MCPFQGARMGKRSSRVRGEGKTIVGEPTNGQERKSIFARLFATTHGVQNAERLL
jgi:hypothetical protein